MATMPNVRIIGNQSAKSDGTSGGRLAAALRPAAVSWRPRRRNHPSEHNSTLATNGIRHFHATLSLAPTSALTSHADPEPRMKPIEEPAAAELPIRPRVAGADSSVV